MGMVSRKPSVQRSKRTRAVVALTVVLLCLRAPTHASGAVQDTTCARDYEGVCIPPSPPDLDCADLAHSNFPVVGVDSHNLDVDGDGTACESAPLPTSKAFAPLYVAALVLLLSVGFWFATRRERLAETPLVDEIARLEAELLARRSDLDTLAEREAIIRDAMAVSAEQQLSIYRVVEMLLERERALRNRQERRFRRQQHQFNRFSVLLTIGTFLGGIVLTLWLAGWLE